jgi:hypothetical protein
VARWLACALPYRRFVDVLANANARLGADADRYSFIVSDFHRLLPAGLPAHSNPIWPATQSVSAAGLGDGALRRSQLMRAHALAILLSFAGLWDRWKKDHASRGLTKSKFRNQSRSAREKSF